MIKIKCRLTELLKEKRVSPEDLANASGLPLDTIQTYMSDSIDSISLSEAGLILSTLGCMDITDLLEEVIIEDVPEAEEGYPVPEFEWNSRCPAAPDGKHRWYKDIAASDTLLQEFTCYACKKKLSVIL